MELGERNEGRCQKFFAIATHTWTTTLPGKRTSRACWPAVQQVVQNLLDCFSPTIRIEEINAGKADDFRKWLLPSQRSVTDATQRIAVAIAGHTTVAERLQYCTAIFADGGVCRSILFRCMPIVPEVFSSQSESLSICACKKPFDLLIKGLAGYKYRAGGI